MARTEATTPAPSGTGPRGRNQRAVVRLLGERGALSRAAIARTLELSPTTVAGIVADLVADGTLVENPADPVTRGRGRPARTFGLAPQGGVVGGVDVGRTHVRAALATADGQVVAEREVPLPLGHSGPETTPIVLDLLADLLEASGRAPGDLRAVGLGLPGPVERSSQTVGPGTILSGWVGYDMAREVGARLGVPAATDNDANLAVLAESRWGAARGVRNAVYVKISTGIGAGMVLDGHLHRGFGGTAGELGHSPLEPAGAVCRCGNRGCLETVASVPSALELLRPTLGPDLTIDQVIEACGAGDPACRRVIEDVGRHVGRGVALLANLVDPELILLGGPFVRAGEAFLGAVRTGLRRDAIPSVAARARVERGLLGDRAAVLGALALALESAPLPGGTG
ncbi:ROK family transcriptional regulator [Georgenia thermotolerans]|uniref:ROK family protein n=1 Tax=Georgenia thermotolerans TaxID=527326 RepID=A0A7J5UQP9_9MICO|nr:ROK family transcriptional regulator [Georgenia thermotolerans]KAE8764659.1 ROK family protein [Georgenia thermotolerans]